MKNDFISRPVLENAPRVAIIRRHGITLISSGAVFGVLTIFSKDLFIGLVCAFAAVVILGAGVSRLINIKRFEKLPPGGPGRLKHQDDRSQNKPA